MADAARQLFRIDPDVTFLNHGSYGACPAEVIAAQRALQDELEWQPVAFMDPRRLGPRLRDAAMRLGAFIGADGEDIVPVVNATAGLNIVARSLQLAAGDEILMTDHEYAALEKTWAFVAARTGARVRQVRVPLPLLSEGEFTGTVAAAFGPRTRVLFLSHVTSATALALPIADVVGLARDRGIVTVIDGAHAPGQIPLDLRLLGADFYAGNCHKWMMAPKGAAFLHARRDMQHLLYPAVISHGWTPDGSSPGPFGGTAFQDAFMFQATRDHSAWLSVPAALDFRDRHRWPEVAARAAALAGRAGEELGRLFGGAPLSSERFRAPQMVSVDLAAPAPADLHDHLLARHRIEIPVYRWQDRSFLRLSVQGYNDAADIARLLTALKDERAAGGVLAQQGPGGRRGMA